MVADAAFSQLRSQTLQSDPALTERDDAAPDTSTEYTLAVGESFSGELSGSHDIDWVRVELEPGDYLISLKGSGASPVADTWLGIYDAAGNLLASNDDSGEGLNSQVGLHVTEKGAYYLESTSYANVNPGGYTLAVSKMTAFTVPQIAAQLTDGYWNSHGYSRRSFDVAPGGTLNVDLSGLTAAGQKLAKAALLAWTDVTGIRFNTDPGPNDKVHIVIDDSDSGAYSQSITFGEEITKSYVNVSTAWIAYYGGNFDSYSYQTFVHELGHALGLGHAGNYDGNATYGVDNHYLNDSWQASIMSYFSQSENSYVNASHAYVMSPMMADIAAMRALYGAASLRVGDTVYGEHSNAGGNYEMISRLLETGAGGNIAFTVFDSGGNDTLDLSGDSQAQRITLASGGISDAYGLIGNISIMQGTVIENLRAGSGNDVLSGNAANNRIWGGAGDDRITGIAGDDTLAGGAGRDTLIGGMGNDSYITNSLDVIIETAGAGRDSVFLTAGHMVLGANLENLFLIGTTAQNGTGNALSNRLVGNAMANQLIGLAGADRLEGNAGNDSLAGGLGNDTLIGGAGADVFLFNHGKDVITDFQDNIDAIRIDDAVWGGGTRSIAQVLSAARVVDGDVVLTFGAHSLTIDGLTNIRALADDLVIV
ncbi:peptidase [Paracoccus limosus]|uniref:Peptidase n=1 Tax=Paracoccus limosus TaxID=913252 RepID=A0A844H3S4_9RHOB|nr:M10 family metallopeptidase C-terminal domain-containing protein [Paracoccus limosus]MTH34193.1 peptidase [Paracoccus limosus]